jgi:SAM-dependent methyltransferase
MAATIHESIKVAYEDVAYVGRPNVHSLPDRLAAIATAFGLAPPDPATARVLEVGCGDGANLLPMAARSPGARFVGCDLSSLLMARARSMAEGLSLANVELIEDDLRALASRLGSFDYIIAHGFYSWVPADVRDALLALARERLAPNGLLCVSYNVFPGCFVRRIGWDAIRLEVAGAATARERLDGARRVRRDLAEAWTATGGAAAQLAKEYVETADRTDSALYHDDMSGVNDPVYFTAFVRHAASHDLAFLSEAEIGTMGVGRMAEGLRAIVASADTIAREQYLDFARVRRFRQSILVRAAEAWRARIAPAALAALHVTAVTGLVQARVQGDRRGDDDPLVAMLIDRFPGSIPVPELIGALVARGTRAEEAPHRILGACFSGAAELLTRPLDVARKAGPRPRAFAVARWQAERGTIVTSLRHEGIRIEEPEGRAILVGADGTRDRAALAARLGGRADAAGIVDHFLARFAYTGLLEA